MFLWESLNDARGESGWLTLTSIKRWKPNYQEIIKGKVSVFVETCCDSTQKELNHNSQDQKLLWLTLCTHKHSTYIWYLKSCFASVHTCTASDPHLTSLSIACKESFFLLSFLCNVLLFQFVIFFLYALSQPSTTLSSAAYLPRWNNIIIQ